MPSPILAMVETTIVLTIVTDKTGSDFWCHETIIKILERICDIFNRPQHFQAIIVAGAFKSMRHDHEFRASKWDADG